MGDGNTRPVGTWHQNQRQPLQGGEAGRVAREGRLCLCGAARGSQPLRGGPSGVSPEIAASVLQG